MTRKPRKSWVVGIFTTLVSLLALNLLFNLDPTCWDGWLSPSIGSQGACSHHGGVNKTLGNLAWIFSVGAGIWAGSKHHKKQNKKSKLSEQVCSEKEPMQRAKQKSAIPQSNSPKPNIEKSLHAPKGISACPIHGTMVESIDGHYWVCSEPSGCDYYHKK